MQPDQLLCVELVYFQFVRVIAYVRTFGLLPPTPPSVPETFTGPGWLVGMIETLILRFLMCWWWRDALARRLCNQTIFLGVCVFCSGSLCLSLFFFFQHGHVLKTQLFLNREKSFNCVMPVRFGLNVLFLNVCDARVVTI